MRLMPLVMRSDPGLIHRGPTKAGTIIVSDDLEGSTGFLLLQRR